MDIKSKLKYFNKIKLVLIFFLSVFLLIGCNQSKEEDKFVVNYKNGKAVSITLKNVQDPKIYIQGEENAAVLGKIIRENQYIKFRPVIPFSEGLTYEIRQGNTLIDTFKIEENQIKTVPRIINIYPSSDTVPQNLLKMYIRFSEPMQGTGNALDFIKVYKNNRDKENPVFLELENDLWNREHTLLTLWLDPGRIKQDLIPNKEQGTPLESGNTYTVMVSDKWNSEKGVSLDSAYVKRIIVVDKKISRPKVEMWNLNLPVANSRNALTIKFPEILDSQLILNTISIWDEKGGFINGSFKLIDREHGVLFTPDENWKLSRYILRIENRLEDLAGNNLDRLFDTDLKRSENQKEIKNYIEFEINRD